MTIPLALSCLTCHGAVEPADRFCEACGADIPQVAAADPGFQPRHEGSCAACHSRARQLEAGYCGECGTRQPDPRFHRAVTLGAVAAVTDGGRVRARNEDAFAVAVAPDGRIAAVVCDGISATAGSDRASQAAADAALAALVGPSDALGCGDLEGAYGAARTAVQQIPWTPEEERAGPPSCTFLAAVVSGRDVRVASLGDCRAIWLPGTGKPRTLTVDDSWAAEQVAAGALTAEAAHRDPRSHGITRWLGRDAEPSWEPRRAGLASAGPGRLVLCSDGLWNYAEEAADIAAACPDGDASEIAAGLVDWANARGGRDNITVAVLDVGMPRGRDHTDEEGPDA